MFVMTKDSKHDINYILMWIKVSLSAILKFKMAAIIYNTAYMYMYESWYSVISSLHILASGAVVNIILASKHMF